MMHALPKRARGGMIRPTMSFSLRALFVLALVGFPPCARAADFTFAVLGDNRGYADGRQTPVFLRIVDEIARANPALVLHTGDMIDGDIGDEKTLRAQWDAYKQAIAPLKMPIFHAPGNHEIGDDQSIRIYQQYWGKTYYSFERGGCFFIALDTETHNGELGDAQWDFLRKALDAAGDRPTFLFFHRPLFPYGAHVKFCLDEFPQQRDRLHQLFVAHRNAIRAVFVGHEHLYAHDERDGIHYYTCGGAGAVLYAPAELGGFYHYLLVHVNGHDASIELHKVALHPEPARPTARIAAGALLDGFESPLFWYTWNSSVASRITSDQHTDGKRALRLDVDAASYPWPALATPLDPALDLRQIQSISMDVHAPADLPPNCAMTVAIAGSAASESPKTILKPGWNTVTADLNGAWLDNETRAKARGIVWGLDFGRSEFAGALVCDNLRVTPRPGAENGPAGRVIRESWENGLLWRTWNSGVSQAHDTQFHTEGSSSIRMKFDLDRCPSPRLYATLDPMLDLGDVPAISLDVMAPGDLPASTLRLVIVSGGQRYLAPPAPLKAGRQHMLFKLDEAWLPTEARKSVEQFDLVITASRPVGTSWISLDNLRAEPK